MATITFDTHKFYQLLEDTGVPRAQAEAMIRMQQESLQAAFGYRDLATKSDISLIRADMATIDGLRKVEIEVAVVKWMLGTVLGGMVALLLKAFLT